MKVSEVKSTEELIELIKVCGWLFAVVVVMLVFGLTVFAMLYSVIFVTQPIKSMAPIDQAFTKLLNDVVLLLVGSISTLIGMFAINKGAKSLVERMNPTPPMQPMCQPMGYGGSQGGFNQSYAPSQTWTSPSGALPAWVNPPLDESWTPGPPPTTPPDHLEDDHDRVQIAVARQESE